VIVVVVVVVPSVEMRRISNLAPPSRMTRAAPALATIKTGLFAALSEGCCIGCIVYRAV